jgi:hypothetical protein
MARPPDRRRLWRARLKYGLVYPAATVAGPAAVALVEQTAGFLLLMALGMGGAGYVVVFGEDMRADSMAASVYAGSRNPEHHTNPKSPLSDRWPLYYAGGVATLAIAAIVAVGTLGG